MPLLHVFLDFFSGQVKIKKCKHVEIFRAQSWPLKWQNVSTWTEHLLWRRAPGPWPLDTEILPGHICQERHFFRGIFHQDRRSASMPMGGRYMYIFTSDTFFSRTLSFPEVGLFCLAEAILCCHPDRLSSFLLVVVLLLHSPASFSSLSV